MRRCAMRGCRPVASWRTATSVSHRDRRAATQLLGGAQPVTAIIASNDQTALASLDIAASLGLAVPRDLSLVSFDDTPMIRFGSPAMTVDQAADRGGDGKGGRAADRGSRGWETARRSDHRPRQPRVPALHRAPCLIVDPSFADFA